MTQCERLGWRIRRRAGTLLLVTGAAVSGGCGIPMPGTGAGSAAPEKPEEVPAAETATARSAALALAAAWERNDPNAADAVSETEAERYLFERPFPDPPPSLIHCVPASRVPAARTCLFRSNDLTFSMTVVHRDAVGWKVRSVKYHA